MTSIDKQTRPPGACTATTAAGTACRARAVAGTEPLRCFAHATELASHRDNARRRGGQNRSNLARARAATDPTLASVVDLLRDALTRVYAGDLEPRVAGAVAQVSGALLRAHEVALLEARLTHLEEAHDRRIGRR